MEKMRLINKLVIMIFDSMEMSKKNITTKKEKRKTMLKSGLRLRFIKLTMLAFYHRK